MYYNALPLPLLPCVICRISSSLWYCKACQPEYEARQRDTRLHALVEKIAFDHHCLAWMSGANDELVESLADMSVRAAGRIRSVDSSRWMKES